jgi:hypothetical protein
LVKGAERVIPQSMPREGRSKAIDLNTSSHKASNMDEITAESGNL